MQHEPHDLAIAGEPARDQEHVACVVEMDRVPLPKLEGAALGPANDSTVIATFKSNAFIG